MDWLCIFIVIGCLILAGILIFIDCHSNAQKSCEEKGKKKKSKRNDSFNDSIEVLEENLPTNTNNNIVNQRNKKQNELNASLNKVIAELPEVALPLFKEWEAEAIKHLIDNSEPVQYFEDGIFNYDDLVKKLTKKYGENLISRIRIFPCLRVLFHDYLDKTNSDVKLIMIEGYLIRYCLVVREK